MLLNDSDISSLASAGMLSDYEPSAIKHCGYLLRAGAAFVAASGNEWIIEAANQGQKSHFWELKPSEILVLMTRESVSIPADVCASYSPLHRLASKGVMLLNPAIVEPLYSGPLSCYLVNFSSKTIQISKDEPISKIVFHRLSAAPARQIPLHFDLGEYKKSLSRDAASFASSFLGIGEIETKAAAAAASAAKTATVAAAWTGGAIIAFLLLWSSIEPITSRYFLEKTGVVGTTQRTADALLLKDIENAKAALSSSQEVQRLERRSAQLEDEVRALRQQLEQLQQRSTGRR